MADHSAAEVAADAAPLEGVVIIDLSLGMAGPFAASRLADLGARVIKVEPLSGDPARGYGPAFVGPDAADSAVFAALNRGKTSLAIDLEHPAGSALIRRLIDQADVVIEDLGPGRARELGLDYDAVSATNPAVIFVAISPWGEQGPLAGQPGAELPVQAMAEYLSSMGRIGDPPVRLGTDAAGLNTGIFASQAALAGLVARSNEPGHGQRVAVSMLGSLLHLRGIMWTARSNPDDWWGFHLDHYTNPPETGYRTSDGQVFFGLRRGNSEDFDQLMISLGLLDHLEDPNFAGFGREAAPLGRYAVEAKPTWEEGFAYLTTQEIVELFHERGGDAVPFTNYPEIAAHPQTAAIGALRQVGLPGGGAMTGVAAVWKFSATPAAITGAAPRLGEHTETILEELGLSPSEVQLLRAQGVVA